VWDPLWFVPLLSGSGSRGCSLLNRLQEFLGYVLVLELEIGTPGRLVTRFILVLQFLNIRKNVLGSIKADVPVNIVCFSVGHSDQIDLVDDHAKPPSGVNSKHGPALF
jgi:hypothetical protein